MNDKVILAFDKPKTCLDCPVCTLDEMDGDYICGKTGKCVEEYFNKKPSWCPLIPLPEKKEIDKTLKFGGYENTIQEALARGYNAYYDEIVGEINEKDLL